MSLQLQQEVAMGPSAGGGVMLLRIQPSTAWPDVDHVSSIVQQRNTFVCMQLVTMVKEQISRVQAATAAGDAAVLHAAQFMFLATLSSKESNSVLAAGLFYPRACSKDGAEMPHMYVELLCCNSPNRGLGSLLLQHIEQFVADNCDAISEGFFGISDAAAGGSTSPIPGAEHPAPTGLSSGSSLTATAAPCNSNPGGACEPAAVLCFGPSPQRRSYSSLPVLLPDGPSMLPAAGAPCIPPAAPSAPGMCLSASSSSVSSLASNVSTSTHVSSMALDGSSTGSCASLSAMQTASLQAASASLSGWSCECGSAGSSAGTAGTSSDVPGAAASCTSGASCGTNSIVGGSSSSSSGGGGARLCRACKVIQGIKLLSVQSAQGFYTKCGYGVPDSSCEMFKPLPALRHSIGSTVLPRQAAC